MKRADNSTPFVLPPALRAQIEAAANKEHRPAVDVLRDAMAGYVKAKRWQRTLAYGQVRAKALAEQDVPGPLANSRQEKRLGH